MAVETKLGSLSVKCVHCSGDGFLSLKNIHHEKCNICSRVSSRVVYSDFKPFLKKVSPYFQGGK
jgi:hypothetical protein